MKLRAVLLDAAGTLIHTGEPVGASYARIAAEHGVAIPAWRLDDAFRRVLRAAPPMPGSGDAAERAWWRDVRARHLPRRRPDAALRGLRGLLRRALRPLRATGCMALGAGRTRRTRRAARRGGDARPSPPTSTTDCRAILAGLDLARDLDLVWLPRDAGVAKPDPRFFRSACERLGVAPAAAVVVGDDPEQDLEARAPRRPARDRRGVAC